MTQDVCFHRRSGLVDHAALARIAARAGSDSRLQPVKHEPLRVPRDALAGVPKHSCWNLCVLVWWCLLFCDGAAPTRGLAVREHCGGARFRATSRQWSAQRRQSAPTRPARQSGPPVAWRGGVRAGQQGGRASSRESISGPKPARANTDRRRSYPDIAAVRSRSISTRRRILPDGDFGISSTISTARTFLYGATRSATNRGHLLGRDRRARHDERLRDLAGLLVGDRDHGRVGDRRVREQQRLQLGGRDLVALVLDQLLEPVDDPQRAAARRCGRCRRCGASRRGRSPARSPAGC